MNSIIEAQQDLSNYAPPAPDHQTAMERKLKSEQIDFDRQINMFPTIQFKPHRFTIPFDMVSGALKDFLDFEKQVNQLAEALDRSAIEKLSHQEGPRCGHKQYMTQEGVLIARGYHYKPEGSDEIKKGIPIDRERMVPYYLTTPVTCKNCGMSYIPADNAKDIEPAPILANAFCSRKCYDEFSPKEPAVHVEPLPTDEFKFCNHHHELTPNHRVVDFGDGQFVANVPAIPLLEALNRIGLRTRTHHVGEPGTHCFVSIIMSDNVSFEIKKVMEVDADRTRYDGKTELLICWKRPE